MADKLDDDSLRVKEDSETHHEDRPFYVIPEKILFSQELTFAELRFLLVVSGLTTRGRKCFASGAWLAGRMGTTENAIRCMMRRMYSKGWLSFESQKIEIAGRIVERRLFWITWPFWVSEFMNPLEVAIGSGYSHVVSDTTVMSGETRPSCQPRHDGRVSDDTLSNISSVKQGSNDGAKGSLELLPQSFESKSYEEKVIDAYHKSCPNLPRLRDPKTTNIGQKVIAQIRQRAKEQGWTGNVPAWDYFFVRVQESGFLFEKDKPKSFVDLKWLTSPEKFERTLRGAYIQGEARKYESEKNNDDIMDFDG